jgi:hypothetical protein
VKILDRLVIMKTSPKTSVALLAILALGGSTAGSLFSESLQTNVINTIGTAGAFFPDAQMPTPIQQVAVPSNPSESETDSGVIALPVEANILNQDLPVETQVRAITNPEVIQTPMADPILIPEPSASPEASIEPSPTPEASPEVSASTTPESSPESE